MRRVTGEPAMMRMSEAPRRMAYVSRESSEARPSEETGGADSAAGFCGAAAERPPGAARLSSATMSERSLSKDLGSCPDTMLSMTRGMRGVCALFYGHRWASTTVKWSCTATGRKDERSEASTGWVAEIPAIPGCHALMPTREEALAELAQVCRLISEE